MRGLWKIAPRRGLPPKTQIGPRPFGTALLPPQATLLAGYRSVARRSQHLWLGHRHVSLHSLDAQECKWQLVDVLVASLDDYASEAGDGANGLLHSCGYEFQRWDGMQMDKEHRAFQLPSKFAR